MKQMLKPDTVFFLGIGGIGMSALARWFLASGCTVSGYDKTPSAISHALEQSGIKIYYTEQIPESFEKIELVVITPAVPAQHPVLLKAVESGIPVVKRAEILGQISTVYPCLAVAGTHGKTSVTALLSHLLYASQQVSLAFVGGVLKNYNTNYLSGNGKWMLAEADEFDRSFLHLNPFAAVISSIDPDHLDVYGDKESFAEGFRLFADKVSQEGWLLLHEQLSESFDVNAHPNIIFYGVEAGDARAFNLRYEQGLMRFDYQFENILLENLKFRIPGKHNVSNAVAALTMAIKAGVNTDTLPDALADFTGVSRRMDIRFQSEGCIYIDDYAHHPEEIQAVLSSVKTLYPGYNLRVAFQPHLYSRTRDFLEPFALSLGLADEVLLLDIYPAREQLIPGISAQSIGEKIDLPFVSYSSLNTLSFDITKDLKKPCILMTLGAGNIDSCVSSITQKLEAAA